MLRDKKIETGTTEKQDYHRRRAGEEQARADAAVERTARRAHQTMADMHSDRAGTEEPTQLIQIQE